MSTSWLRLAPTGLALLVAASTPAGADLVVSADTNALETFTDGARGNAAPLRAISGSSTGLALPRQIDVDPVHNEIFTPSLFDGRVDVFPATGSGNLVPLRTIRGPSTLLYQPSGIAVDLTHGEVIVGNFAHDTGGTAIGRIAVFPLSANGNVAPTRVIFGPQALLSYVAEVAVDPANGEIYVVSQGQSPAVLVFDRLANGDVAPVRRIGGASTRLASPFGIALDLARGEILVSDRTGALLVFARGANGNVAPLRSISGSATGFTHDLGGLSVINDAEIAVVDSPDLSIKVFPRAGNGNIAPIRRLAGAATGLGRPSDVAVYHPALQLGGRFIVQTAWRTPDGNAGGGKPTAITPDTGDFWFFSAANLEVVAKVLNGCGVNGHFWVFAGGLTNVYANLEVTDPATGQVRRYVNPQGTKFAPVQDTTAFATCGAAIVAFDEGAAAAPSGELAEDGSRAGGSSCSGLCLNNGRFQVSANWRTPQGQSGAAHAVALTADTGYLWFFSAANVEAVVKVLDGCGVNGKYWVFAGGLTNVQVDLTVLDTLHSQPVTYHNPQGTAFRPIQDTAAFATCP